MSSYTNHEKRIWEDTPAGKLYTSVKKLYADKETQKKWTDDDQRKVDIIRATSLSKERDITEDFQKQAKELEATYKSAIEAQLERVLKQEFEYLELVSARPNEEKHE